MKTDNSFTKKYIERLESDKITIFLFHGVIKKIILVLEIIQISILITNYSAI